MKTGYNVLLWLLRRRKLYRVTGESMEPFLKAGEVVFVDLRAYRRNRPKTGEVVILWHPHQKNLRIIKRIETVTRDGRYVVQGDNPEASTDSRSFGPVALEAIIGRVE